MFNYTDLIGVQYKKNGRDIKGLDCYGLVKTLHDRMGKHMPDYATPDNQSLINQLINTGKLDCEELQEQEPGCIVLFKIPPFSLHMGVVLDKEKFVHIIQHRNVAVERLDSRIWSKLRVGYYRWKI